MFSLDSLQMVADALKKSDSAAMLGIVQELERNGHNLQHFCRELARYIRNLLVVRIAGQNSRLVAASAQEQERMAEAASGFSEEDLTRYLQITLDLFKDLQLSLQPRLHLELGLLRMVQAGKLMSIEEALSMVAGGAPSAPSTPPKPSAPRGPAVGGPPPASTLPERTGASPFLRDVARKTAAPLPTPPAPTPTPLATPPAPSARPSAIAESPAPTLSAVPNGIDWRSALHSVLLEMQLITTADAVEHSTVTFSGTELNFVTGRLFCMAIKGDPDLPKIVQQIAGRPVKITVKQGEVAAAASLASPRPQNDAELTERALSHPEVQRFRELFPDAHVRDVRNLKD
jgi:DNA polymerase-3 subunit gamma/tau